MLAYLLAIALSGCATQTPLTQLISEQKPIGTLVVVQGFVSLDFEGKSIYLTQDDCLKSDGNHLWLTLRPGIKPRGWSRCEFAKVVGIYDPQETGHFGMSPLGGLIDVSQIRGISEP